MQDSDRPYKFAEPWAINATGTLVTNPIPITSGGTAAASQDLGFPPATAMPTGSGGTPPAIWDFNGAFFYETSWSRWLQAGAAIPRDSTFQTAIGGYPTGALVRNASDYSSFWRSTANNNVTNPDAAGAGWEAWPFLGNMVQNGYQKFANGLILQWGLANVGVFAAGGGPNDQAVSFNIPFPNALLFSIVGPNGSGLQDVTLSSRGSTLSAFIITSYPGAGTTAYVQPTAWLALGN